MVDFKNLKRNSSSGDTSKLKAAAEATTAGGGSDGRENFWKCETDKSGNGQAVIRFLPAPAVDGDDALPWVKVFSHGFQGPGGWLIDNCLTTKNKDCPVCEHNSKLWNSGVEANKEIVRKQKRKLNYIANVYIVSDPKHPENEGQIKLYKFGAKIFEKITSAMNPSFDDEVAINPFDFWTGANFKLKICKVEGYQNYDKSTFADQSALSDDDTKLEKIWKAELSLNDLVADKEFKPYEDLKNRLEKVLGLSGGAPVSRTTVETLKEAARSLPKKPAVEDTDISSEDDDLKYFERLALEE